jgi:hypothetical protein
VLVAMVALLSLCHWMTYGGGQTKKLAQFQTLGKYT